MNAHKQDEARKEALEELKAYSNGRAERNVLRKMKMDPTFTPEEQAAIEAAELQERQRRDAEDRLAGAQTRAPRTRKHASTHARTRVSARAHAHMLTRKVLILI